MPDVLVVDDNRVIREMLEDLLLVNGYDVVAAAHGRAALDVLQAGQVPRMILLDIDMPVMDGRQLLEHLRGSDFAAVPVVVRSSLVDSSEEVDALARRFGCEVIARGAGLVPVLDAVARHCRRSVA